MRKPVIAASWSDGLVLSRIVDSSAHALRCTPGGCYPHMAEWIAGKDLVVLALESTSAREKDRLPPSVGQWAEEAFHEACRRLGASSEILRVPAYDWRIYMLGTLAKDRPVLASRARAATAGLDTDDVGLADGACLAIYATGLMTATSREGRNNDRRTNGWRAAAGALPVRLDGGPARLESRKSGG